MTGNREVWRPPVDPNFRGNRLAKPNIVHVVDYDEVIKRNLERKAELQLVILDESHHFKKERTVTMNFSHALEMLNDGHALARKAWAQANTDQTAMLNAVILARQPRAKNTYDYGVKFVVVMTALSLPPFNTQGTDRKVNDRTAQWIGEDKDLNSRPYFSIYDPANNTWQPGWLPSTEDIFADDWIAL